MADFGVGETILASEIASEVAAPEIAAAALPTTAEIMGGGGAFLPAAGLDASLFSALPEAGTATAAATGAGSAAMAPAQNLVEAQNLANVTGNAVNPETFQTGMQQVSGGPQSFEQMAHQGQVLTDQGWQQVGQNAAKEGIQQVAQNAPQSISGANQIIGEGANAKVLFPDGTTMPYADWAKSIGMQNLTPPGAADAGSGIMGALKEYQTPLMVGAGLYGVNSLIQQGNRQYGVPTPEHYTGALSKFNYDPSTFKPTYPTPAVYKPTYAEGGIAALGSGGRMTSDPVNVDFMHGDMYPMSQQNRSYYATPTQMPTSAQQVMASYEPKTNPLTGEPTAHMREGGIAQLAVGGKLLKGQGDGMSDSIQANISGKQEARLADGEFVVPADVVSHLGNGSTDAGAKQLYSMMDKVRQARTGTKKQGKQINPGKYVPA